MKCYNRLKQYAIINNMYVIKNKSAMLYLSEFWMGYRTHLKIKILKKEKKM